MSDAPSEQFSMQDPRTTSEADLAFAEQMNDYFSSGLGTPVDKLRNFAKYVPRQTLTQFLAKNEIFRRVLRVQGHIVECGVFFGGGLMTWGQLSAIYEPTNTSRRVVGFDTFSGFVRLSEKNHGAGWDEARPGGFAADAEDDIRESIRLFDLNRPIGHVPRVEVVAGNAAETIPAYVRDNPQLVVALLYLDFDLYEPTRVALEHFLPRMPKGAVVAFDELNDPSWPGETQAVMDAVGLTNLRVRRLPFATQISYAVL